MMQIVTLKIRAKPSAKVAQFQLLDDELVAAIPAPPVDGQANKELLKMLAKKIAVTQSQVAFKTGETSKHKFVRITSVFSKEELLEKLVKN